MGSDARCHGAEVRLDHGKAAASGHVDWRPAGLAAYGGGRDRISLQRYVEEWTIRRYGAGIRGMSAENLIKLHKAQLASDRTSCRSPLANQMRLILHTAAYWLMLT